MSVPVPALPLRAPGGAVEIPVLGLGTWQARGAEAYDAVRTALDLGFRHVDTATMYANERDVGRALADSGVDRDELFVTTKLPPDRAGQEAATLEASLRALGLEHVDLWLVHWPPQGRARPETWERFVEAQQAGRTRAIGVSNYSAGQIDELAAATGVTPAIDQIPWSPRDYDPAVVDALRSRSVVLEGYSPFKRTPMSDATLVAVAHAHGVTPQQVVLRWHVQHGFVVIPKSVTPARIAQNADVFGFALTDAEMAALDGLGQTRR
ncbi:aldo/keto reductase [Georgenia thermotolerans]|uniref:Aldo/keto reductase n=1 Tax=Georgenia thermotolerans TaxID=527326 RepID=A0A7J5UNX3_9MICO|nr:aldo/keto reductase [Georgenia thermotolerans]KAE8764102.1 aldo/keto reductase [Georgenia thermotolerans]